MFYGQQTKTLDDKERIIIPAEFRKALEADEESEAGGGARKRGAGQGEFFLTITPGQGKCISLFPAGSFIRLFLQFKPYDCFVDSDVQAYARLIAGRSHKSACDKQGRLSLPAHLRDDVGIKKDVVIVGVVDHVEVWDVDAWSDYNREKRPSITDVAARIHRGRPQDER